MKRVFLLPMILLAIARWSVVARAERSEPAVFFVDSEKGCDLADGLTPPAAWRTLERVNRAALIPGDQVRFKRGGLWRGQLRPRSGHEQARIVYGAYGEGHKPILQGSVARNQPQDWEEIRPGLWATRPPQTRIGIQLVDTTDSFWDASFQDGAAGSIRRVQENGLWFNRVTCETSGGQRHQIQLWGPLIREIAPSVLFRLRARSSHPFALESFALRQRSPPWTLAMQGLASRHTIGTEWQDLDILLAERHPMEAANLHVSLGGILPSGAQFDFQALGIWRADLEGAEPLAHDVGILILNHGERWGVKRWRLEDVQAPLDYWHDLESQRLYVAWATQPTDSFQSIELALTRHLVDQGNSHDILYEGLALRYGAAHGFGGANTRRITIRDCDISWIGGGLQHIRADGRPVRYGNAIEFWNGAEDHLVEHNRIWEIYDAALTNQGQGQGSTHRQARIIYRHNVIWNAEYAFEYWNRPETATTQDILFEHNTSVNAGGGWAHAQRPDPNGAHLMFFENSAATSNVVVRNNIFAGSTHACLRMENDWRSGLILRNNLYWQQEQPVVRWLRQNLYAPDAFQRYQTELGMDAHSILAQPIFRNPEARDYRLAVGSPGLTLATDGGAVGARPALQTD